MAQEGIARLKVALPVLAVERLLADAHSDVQTSGLTAVLPEVVGAAGVVDLHAVDDDTPLVLGSHGHCDGRGGGRSEVHPLALDFGDGRFARIATVSLRRDLPSIDPPLLPFRQTTRSRTGPGLCPIRLFDSVRRRNSTCS